MSDEKFFNLAQRQGRLARASKPGRQPSDAHDAEKAQAALGVTPQGRI